MVQLDFAVSATWGGPATAALAAHSTPDAMLLRYDFLLGDLILLVGGVDLSARWKWVTLLDAAAAFRRVVDRLEGGATHVSFDFTENSDTIQFRAAAEGRVYLSASYAEGEGCTTFVELRVAVLEFVERVLDAAIAAYPDLVTNPSLPEWYPSSRFAGGKPQPLH